MKAIKFILSVVYSCYSFSADPNLFGSIKRRKAKDDLASEFRNKAAANEAEIKQTQSQNPFESAAAKAAMSKASMGARQMQTRMMNTMGSGASPEAMVSATGGINQALGSAAGNIAVGSEANKINEINSLRGLESRNMEAYAGIKSDSIDEQGQGWKDFFANIGEIGQAAAAGAQFI